MTKTAHEDLHSNDGALRGERPGRAPNPLIKVTDLAWLEFEKPDLDRTERFAHAFGLTTVERTPQSLYLRGTFAGTHSMVVHKSRKSRFVGPAFHAADAGDIARLTRLPGASQSLLRQPGGGTAVTLADPNGMPVRVVHGVEQLPPLPDQQPLALNFGTNPVRINATQRPPRQPARVQRLGHLVLQTRRFNKTLDWYLDTLGMIVSDFLFLDSQRDRGPLMAFVRCDRGNAPADHHTLALVLGPSLGYVHSAYQVSDLDAMAAGGQFLADEGYQRAWGIGRHVQGSQLFDYWRDPDHLMVEHFADGDLFDTTVPTGWAPMSVNGLAQWGPPVTKDFLGASPSPETLRNIVAALREDNEITVSRLVAMVKAMLPR
ncbi:VOC family protein [Nocardia sp. CA2R105]|uniref:VOC family protein n=1 Tax=Nocardia coffeae TaxID=2873381 RepID=UPI001CA6E1C4|nr:VOC family protein [Nocardia coffeae]MBY8863407.1 VOC family protein [Nocardia coffeae]